MSRRAPYKLFAVLITVVIFGAAAGCDWLTDVKNAANPEKRLHHVVFFNSGTTSWEIMNSDPDIASQGNTWIIVNAVSGVAAFDWKARPHTVVVRTLVTHQIVGTISNLQPDEVDGNLSYIDPRGNEYDHLDAYYNLATGEWHP